MNGVIEALHVYDDNRSPILSHTYTGRPLSAAHLLSLYLEHPFPRPSLIYLPNANPPTLVFSLTHSNLLFLATASTEIEPLLVLEFLHRIIDAFEDFVGAPLLAVKLENNYDVIAQLLTEMCDAGTVSTTEPNALREVVEMEGWVDKLLGSINLPGKSPLNTSPAAPSLIAANSPAVPWRRANVRHTSNELYADVVETLSVTLAPSGRPLAAFANGTIAFTSKVSGVPDVLVTLGSPSGKHNIGGIMELPVFHPCVRLARWNERPGELSFIPPDGRFILAGYEVDLLPFTGGKSGSVSSNNLKLPVNLEMKTGLGPVGSEFEVRLQTNKIFGTPNSSSAVSQLGRAGVPGRLSSPHPGSPSSPLLDDLIVTIPLPEDVRNLSDIRPSRGDASFNRAEGRLEWHIPAKELSGPTSHFGLRCTVVGSLADDEEEEFDPTGFGFGTDYSYNEPYQSAAAKSGKEKAGADDEQDPKKTAQNKILMPSSAAVSFSVKGWLASGLKIESIVLDSRKSRGLSEGVKPYKGVKYLTVSKGGSGSSLCPTCFLSKCVTASAPSDEPLLRLHLHHLSHSTRLSPHADSGPAKRDTELREGGISVSSSIGRRKAMKRFAGPVLQRRRGARVSRDASELTRALRCCAPASGASAASCPVRWSSSRPGRPRTAIFFPGQGVQKVGMLSPWLEAFPATASHIIDEIDHVAGFKLSDVIQNGPSKVLTQTTNAQPAIMATSIFILRILEREFNFRVADHFDFTLGHSLGEFTALVAGGYLSFEDSYYLVQRRAAAMSEATKKAIQEYGGEYGMVAVITEPEYLQPLIKAIRDFVGHSSDGSKSESSEDVPPIEQVLIANINSKNQIVLSGNMERIKTLIAHVRQFLGHDPRAVRLHSDSPFHSPIMKPAVTVMKNILAKKSRVPGRENEDMVTFPGLMPCISNVSARPFQSKDQLKDLLARGCLETVRWWASIKYLDQEEKVRRWVGIGPGKVGRNLVGKEVGMRGKDLVKGGGVWAITDPFEVEEVLRGLEETANIVDDEDE
ncbi:clathrin adaptor, mu subunit [Trichoderma longibrachiatum ATCC 18648]|uniref:[acyl-carrier-protein] S-malonyltransferase n=1 Tax=Trichoderma longibrachiatum ATCC 18648 TaxID=983965 RepID=A0A2T4BZ01_TRILO|nr:clathrin adaptor, mu subunit [Trichoderma longibrachiatum ATCC 18648]